MNRPSSVDDLPLAFGVSSGRRYAISVNPRLSYLHLEISGLWDAEDVARFHADLATAIERMVREGTARGSMRLLADVRNSSITPQAIIGAVQGVAEDLGPAIGRAAILCSSVLQKLQYQRMLPQSAFPCYMSSGDASRWLFADQ